MQLAYIIAIVIVVPVLLFLAVFVWYMNRGAYDAGKKARAIRTTLEKIARGNDENLSSEYIEQVANMSVRYPNESGGND